MIGYSDCCFICGAVDELQTHHCLSGSYRKLAEQYGMTVKLCANCHTMNADSVHREPSNKTKRLLQKVGQIWAMEHYQWTTDDFIRHIGKNFL